MHKPSAIEIRGETCSSPLGFVMPAWQRVSWWYGIPAPWFNLGLHILVLCFLFRAGEFTEVQRWSSASFGEGERLWWHLHIKMKPLAMVATLKIKRLLRSEWYVSLVVLSHVSLMFWTNWNEQRPSIMRSTLAGKNMRIIIGADILTPNGLTIDHKAEKLYFSDGSLGKIERCDFDGSSRYVSMKIS